MDRRDDPQMAALARIYVPPHVGTRGGKTYKVDGYWRSARTVAEGLKNLTPEESAARAETVARGAEQLRPDASGQLRMVKTPRKMPDVSNEAIRRGNAIPTGKVRGVKVARPIAPSERRARYNKALSDVLDTLDKSVAASEATEDWKRDLESWSADLTGAVKHLDQVIDDIDAMLDEPEESGVGVDDEEHGAAFMAALRKASRSLGNARVGLVARDGLTVKKRKAARGIIASVSRDLDKIFRTVG